MKSILTLACVLTLGCGSGGDPTINFSKNTTPIVDADIADIDDDVATCEGGQRVIAQSDTPSLLTTPSINLVFWGSWWVTSQSSQLNSMILAWNTIANDQNFYSSMAEYGIGNGSLKGTYITNWNVVDGPLSEDYIQAELQQEITNSNLPPSNNNSIFIIELPSGVSSQYNIDNGYSGHHSSVSGIFYAVIEYDSSDVMNTYTSHEIYEACTDPDGSGFRGGSGETEIGDYCGGQTYSLDGFTIQTLWGQKECACLP
jgi:hypothetical protein